MRSLSSNLFKAGWVIMNEDARIIDTNKLMEQRLKKAAASGAAYQNPPRGVEEEDGFSSGLEADEVDALLDPNGEGAVLKNASREELEAIKRELEEAREELSQVREEAGRVMEDANVQIEKMRASALEEARAQGYEEGRKKAMDEVDVLKEECLRRQAELEEEYESRVEALEPDFVDALTEIYEHIFKVDLSSYHGLVMNLLTDAMQKTDSAHNYIVHVSKQDYPEVIENREKILEETGTLSSNCEIISDMTLSASQCMIETESGIYDCSLGTELEELKRKLKLIAFRK